MTTTREAFDIPAFINAKPIGITQYLIVMLCGFVMFLDGFDTQSISYMAPLIAKDWGLSRDLLGPIFSSALVGLMVGYLALSPMSDRFGHRRLVLASTIAFGLVTLVTAMATSYTALLAFRFVTGVALGAAVPSAVALTSEYSPQRLRATFVLLIYCGFSLGFVAAGAASAWLLPLYSWHSLFLVGGIAPVLLSLCLYAFLPESLDFMVRTNVSASRIWQTLRRVDSRLPSQSPTTFRGQVEIRRTDVGGLFSEHRAFGTIVLWVVFFMNLALFYAFQSWLPTILSGLGYPLPTVALATSLTTLGGIAIVVVIGPAMDRIGPYLTLSVLYFVGTLFVVFLGAALSQPQWILLTAAFLMGTCVSGAQKSVIALAAVYYPSAVRSTGVGWALGIGRLGGIGGPVLVGWLLAMLTPAKLFYAAAIPMMLSGLLIAVLGFRYGADRKLPASALGNIDGAVPEQPGAGRSSL